LDQERFFRRCYSKRIQIYIKVKKETKTIRRNLEELLLYL